MLCLQVLRLLCMLGEHLLLHLKPHLLSLLRMLCLQALHLVCMLSAHVLADVCMLFSQPVLKDIKLMGMGFVHALTCDRMLLNQLYLQGLQTFVCALLKVSNKLRMYRGQLFCLLCQVLFNRGCMSLLQALTQCFLGRCMLFLQLSSQACPALSKLLFMLLLQGLNG